MNYRDLTKDEITVLESNGCFSEQWELVQVVETFKPEFCKNVQFSGVVKLGEFGKNVNTVAGMVKRSGIYNAHIHNCEIHDNVYIRHVSNGIANYTIKENVFIENVDLLAVEGETTFGNGVHVPVMNESGGREVPMFKGLTAQIAYLLAFYRHRPRLVAALTKIIHEKVDSFKATHGVIEKNCRLINCETVTNTFLGEYSYLHGVQRVHNATVNSSADASVEIGNGVIADNIIINGNSRIYDGVLVDTCFIGDGSELAKQYSAEKSLFFSNFLGHHGEAYGIFAGPHTATHHKSTLLISAYMSFLNAGSGSNQSNHLYKLGPLHQGVVDRGSKTGSNSYVLWPAHIGAFTLILGRHMNHPDVSELPYSYLIEADGGDSLLIPGVNIKSVGTIRDADKWPNRDKRSATCEDIINYDLLSPYSVGKMKKAQDILRSLLENSHHNERTCRYNGVKIPKDSIEKGISYYHTGIVKYVGNILAKRLLVSDFANLSDLMALIEPDSDKPVSEWIDMAGLVLPVRAVEELIAGIEKGSYSTVHDITAAFQERHNSYDEWSWNWCLRQIEKFLNKVHSEFTVDDILYLMETWIAATEELDDHFVEDAVKEFSPRTRISFGIDGDRLVQEADFLAVRGSVEHNDFIGRINQHLQKKTRMYTAVVKKLKDIN